MKKYILSIFFVFTAFFAKAQTVCDTVYCLFNMADTTNTSGAIVNDQAFTAFGYVEYECLSTGDTIFYRRVKRFLDSDYKAVDLQFAVLDYKILSDNLRTASGEEGFTRPSSAPELTTNQIAYGDGDGLMTSSSDFVVDVSGGSGSMFVGINTATPTVALDVVGSILATDMQAENIISSTITAKDVDNDGMVIRSGTAPRIDIISGDETIMNIGPGLSIPLSFLTNDTERVRIDGDGTVNILQVLKLSAIAFASLPTGVAGMLAHVSDSSTNTWGATISGGGANTVLAFFNGTNWTVMGK